MTDSEADGEEVMYCDVDDMGLIDDMGPVELSDRQSDEMQSPYVSYHWNTGEVCLSISNHFII